ncbi:MAG: hypothetical protein AB7O62_01395 [Pirellulales bacterium]
MNTPADDNLAWLAFCYVADEMAPAEMIAFEERLEHDQTAREAVAQVVQLSAAVKTVESARLAPSASAGFDQGLAARTDRAARPQSMGRFAMPATWMALGAAACLAVVVAWQSWNRPVAVVDAIAVPDANLIEHRQVAQAWTEVGDDRDDDSLDDDSLDDLDSADEVSDDVGSAGDMHPFDDDSLAADWEASSWISAGVAPQESTSPAVSEEDLP